MQLISINDKKPNRFIDTDLFDKFEELRFQVLKITNDSKYLFGLIHTAFIIVDLEKSEKDKYFYIERYQDMSSILEYFIYRLDYIKKENKWVFFAENRLIFI
jgi:hypothetical protein